MPKPCRHHVDNLSSKEVSFIALSIRRDKMKTMTVGELKAHFSEVLGQMVKTGEPIAISYGKKKEKIAAIIPYSQLKPQAERSLGLMQGRASCIINDDFALSDEEMLNA